MNKSTKQTFDPVFNSWLKMIANYGKSGETSTEELLKTIKSNR